MPVSCTTAVANIWQLFTLLMSHESLCSMPHAPIHKLFHAIIILNHAKLCINHMTNFPTIVLQVHNHMKNKQRKLLSVVAVLGATHNIPHGYLARPSAADAPIFLPAHLGCFQIDDVRAPEYPPAPFRFRHNCRTADKVGLSDNYYYCSNPIQSIIHNQLISCFPQRVP